MSSISVSQKKRGRPSTGVSPRVGVRLSPEILDALDHFVANNPDLPEGKSRSELLRMIVSDWLIGNGYLKPAPE